jgi:16S rRNA processing protein RimM
MNSSTKFGCQTSLFLKGAKVERSMVVKTKMDNLLRVGIISSTHGLRGEVKVYSTTDDLQRFKELTDVIIDTGDKYINLKVEGVKFFKKQAILKFKGIDHINDIEKYKGKDILVTRENAVKLDEDEYFIVDIIGSTVITDEETVLGELIEVLETGANDVYVVKTKEGKEILLPCIKECILDVNPDEKIIKVHVMDGLL